MYGAKQKEVQATVSVEYVNAYPNGQQTKSAGSWPNTFPAHNAHGFSRSGTNASGLRGSGISQFPGTVERVPVVVRKGPRLPYKVWSKRLGKWVWARRPITIYRLRRVKSKIRPAKGMDLPPNMLNFSSSRVSYFGGNDGQGGGYLLGIHYDPQYTRSYRGPLWTDFLLNGGYLTIEPNPQNYMGSTVSSDITSALTDLDLKCRSKFYSDVKNQEVNFAQALAERAQTSGMILDLTKRLVTAVRSARRGNLSKAAKTLFPGNSKELANDWLVLQYGINPLISDIKGAINVLQDGSGEIVFDVISRRTKKFPRDEVYRAVGNGGSMVTTVTRHGKCTVVYKARLRIKNPFGQWASETGLSDVALLGWELLPYSFVIDWLLPIGDYLQNKSAFTNLEIVHLHTTQFAEEYVEFKREFLAKRDNNGYMWSPHAPVGFINKRVQCSRRVLTDLPKLPYPSFKDPTSLVHIANAIALLRQLR